jgi:ATPase subunit of ABC transporter with duplicated ATPase domains
LNQLSEAEQYLRILQVHNTDTLRIRHKYITYCELREQAREEGVSFEELRKQHAATEDSSVSTKGKGPGKKKVGKKLTGLAAAKRRFAKQANTEVVIKMKDKDGQVINFDE